MKKNFIPLIERETIITYNEAENIANVYTMNRKLSRKLSDMAQEYPSLVKFVRTYPDGALEYELPKKSIAVNRPRTKGFINTPKAPNLEQEFSEKLKGVYAEVPETDRVLVVTPATYQLMKKSKDIILETDIGEDMRLRGVIGNLDGMSVQKVPANRLPEKFGFMVAHPSATVGPVKLEDYKIHTDTIYSSGAVVTGRICYDAFVLDNKKTGIYYQATT